MTVVLYSNLSFHFSVSIPPISGMIPTPRCQPYQLLIYKKRYPKVYKLYSFQPIPQSVQTNIFGIPKKVLNVDNNG